MKRTAVVAALAFVFLATTASDCEPPKGDVGHTQRVEQKVTERNHERLMQAVAPPQLDTSLERQQLRERLLRFNEESKISYIYLVSYGKVMAFYTIKGKVSSVNSKLTTSEQIVDDPHGTATAGGKVVESPALDGSYGTNGDAVFFFTTEGVYVEWSGEYLLCDEPLHFSTPPELVMHLDEKG